MSEEKSTQVESETSTVMCALHDIGVRVAATNLGQFAVKKIDKILWIIENTAKWSVPQNMGELNTIIDGWQCVII